jgi:GNAT superfamily N-acetyltransferase
MSTPPLSELLDRWVEGWCLARGIVREPYPGGWLVHVAATTRRVEYFVVSPTAVELTRLADLAGGQPDVWVTVLGVLPGEPTDRLKALTHDERMMTADLRSRALPLDVEIESVDGVAHAIAVVNGESAAAGQVAVSGSDAVFDRIATEPAFRRHGFAGRIMNGLEQWAVSQAATIGLLMASVDGRPLYVGLGWREVAPLVTFCGTRPPEP